MWRMTLVQALDPSIKITGVLVGNVDDVWWDLEFTPGAEPTTFYRSGGWRAQG